MKILAIRGQNLASLEGTFEIDFTKEPLRSAGIFAISGPTGAGKSTLLDAMCLALFGCTPRTEQARENKVRLQDVNDEQLAQSDPRFLLRRGTASGYAEVDFVALDGHRFRARWSVSRSRGKEDGRLKQAQVTLHDLDKAEEMQGSRSELQARIVELLGLTFDQFTRSVLLAQNDFSTFLKADQSEKALLLEKLTGTEQYSAVSRLVFEKAARAKEAYDGVHRQIQEIELLPEEAEQALRDQLAAKEKDVERLEQAKAEQQKLQAALRAAEQLLAVRRQQQKEVAERLLRATERLNLARREYDAGVEEQRQSEAAFRSLQQDIQRARTLDVQVDAASRDLSLSDKQLSAATARRQEAEGKHRAALHRLKQSTDEVARLKAWQERHQAKARMAEQPAALRLHLDAASAARDEAEALQGALAEGQRQLEQAEQQQRTLQANAKQLQQALERSGATDPRTLEQRVEQLRQERERLLLEQARLTASGDILELRRKLQEGQPCPVCGSLRHPYVAQATDVASMVSAISRLTRQTNELEMLQKSLADNERRQKELAGRQRLLTERQKHNTATWNEQTLRLRRSLAAANLLFGSDTWQQAWRRDPAAFLRTSEDFARQWQENTAKLRRLERQAGAQQAECTSLASFLPTLAGQEEEAKEAHAKHQAACAALREERLKLLDGQPADHVEQAHAQRMEQLKERLRRLLETQNEQRALLEQTRGVADQIAREQAAAATDLARRQQALAAWDDASRAHIPDGQTLEALLAQAERQRTALAFRLHAQAENRAKASDLRRQEAKLEAENKRWAQLNELIGSADGAKFRRVAQGYALDVLLGDANVQLRALSRRYRLERVPGTLALQVIDRDMCDEVRSVHSLSGGESFLVSLALALGLSSLSANRMKVESLFIDEGFGSLDADTLRVAMDALENLHMQGRKIGVISHVREMTERIAVRIQVRRMGNGRSRVEFEP